MTKLRPYIQRMRSVLLWELGASHYPPPAAGMERQDNPGPPLGGADGSDDRHVGRELRRRRELVGGNHAPRTPAICA